MERIGLPASRRWPPHGVAADRLLAVLVGLGAVVEIPTSRFESRTPLLVGLALVLSATLAWRRTQPLAALAAGCAVYLLMTALDLHIDDLNSVTLAFFVLIYSVSMWSPLRPALVGLGVAAGTTVAGVVAGGAKWEDFVFATVMVSALWGFGRVLRARVSQVGRLTEEVVRAELAVEAQRVAAVTEERHRVARELHDIVSHGLGVMVIQAAAAESAVGDAPEDARAAMRAVQEVGRQAQAEMVRMVGLLRDSDVPDEIAPQPGLDDVEALVARSRSAGQPVELRTADVPVLPAGLSLTAYRVVQEALTNAARHAPGSATAVAIGYDDGCLRIDVVNTAATSRQDRATTGSGHGLIGMRERVATWGGRLTTEPTPDGGFRVLAELPVTG